MQNSTFLRNWGSDCSGIYIEASSESYTYLSSLLFLDSQGGPPVAKVNARVNSRFRTSNCSFQGGSSNLVKMEGGRWEDEGSSLKLLNYTAVVLTQQAKAVLIGMKAEFINVQGGAAAIHLM